jgi:hypothetical protein
MRSRFVASPALRCVAISHRIAIRRALRPSSHRALRRLKSLRCVATAATQVLRRDISSPAWIDSLPVAQRIAGLRRFALWGDEGPQPDGSSGLGFLCLTDSEFCWRGLPGDKA